MHAILILLFFVAVTRQAPSTSDVGKLVSEWTEDMEVNPEELGDYIEGDLRLNGHKNGLVDDGKHWPGGVVPFEIDGYFTSEKLKVIQKAMELYHEYTCIRFKKKSEEDEDYVAITSDSSGCWSNVGRMGGRQEVNLQQDGCLSRPGTAVHELMHALGFTHEQNRFDRDDYVDIHWENIQSKREGNFVKAAEGATSAYGVDYDYSSVLHYSGKAFSKNGKPTIVPKAKDVNIGQRDGFSKGDILKIRAMYNCTGDTGDIPNVVAVQIDESNSNSIAGGILSFLFN